MALQTDVKKEIVLKVQDPDPSHVGRNIVTLDRQSKNLLEVTSGDIVEIQGTKKTAAIIWPARQEDESQGLIRMDNLIRHNAGISLGEKVVVRKAEFKEAKKVTLAPTQEVRIIASGYDRILKKSFIGRPLNKGDNVWISVFGSGFIYTVVDSNPRGIVKVTDFTQFVLKEEPVKEALEGVPKIAYEDIGGLDEQVKKVREMIELPMKHPELFRKLGINPPKGVLLHGSPGTGKTLLAKAVANETQAHFISINAPAVMSKFVGEAEERIRQMFKEAEENAPSIIFIDEIDAIAPKREEVVGEVERRVVAQLLALMDGMEARGNVIVIAATNRVNSLDEALRRPGRFDREIEIGVPDKKGRKDILQIHTRGMPLTKDVDLDYIASITHGFVGADLEALAKEAAMKALRRYLPEINLEEEEIPQETLEKLEVNKKDFNVALREVQPSALREVMVEIPNIHWNEIGGLENAKQELKQAVEWPLKDPMAFKRMGIRPPTGILLYGPPGTGKTLLAKAIATESEANFISIKGPELISKWVGDSLPFDEEILIFENGKFLREKIGKIVEQKRKAKVVSFDSDGRIILSEITDFIKHELNGKMLEIITKTGRKIKVTDKHSLFGVVDNEIDSVTPLQLVEGKSVIAVPSRIPNIVSGNVEINLMQFFRDSNGLMVQNVQKEMQLLIEKLGYERIAQEFNIGKKTAYEIVSKNLSVDLKTFMGLANAAQIAIDYSNALIGVKGARGYISAIMSLNEELMLLIGLWIAEGDYNQGMVRIHNMNDEIRQCAIEAIKRINLPCSVSDKTILISSQMFKKVFEEFFNLNTGAFNKKIPAIALTLNSKLAANLLKGYFSGDGSISKRERCYIIEATTVSKELANDLMYLFLKLGIVASCKMKHEWNNNYSYRIQIQGVENFKKFLQVGFIDSKRNSFISKNIEERKWARSNVIPATEKIQNILSEAFGSYANVEFVGTKKLMQALQLVDLEKKKYADLWRLSESDIYWDKVESIKEVDYSGFVYDIGAEPCHNFLAGFGGIFAHNSEKGVKKIFRKARQVAPCIIFFDEIDSIASSRDSAGNDSGVTERVVAQLLTELGGVEEMKDVVFIAATNRPDLIDSALLRPGRIDKMILVSAPDEATRLSIFKIHTKNVPLSKDFNLEKLSAKTEGYSGADIEGLVREAALIAMQEAKMKPTEVSLEHFTKAMQKVLPSITNDVVENYAQFREEVRENYSITKPKYVD